MGPVGDTMPTAAEGRRSEANAATEGAPGRQDVVDFETAISLTGHGFFSHIIVIMSFVAMLAHQNEMSTAAYLLPSAGCDLELTAQDKGLLNAMSFMGMTCSSFMWGYISDTVGRRVPLIVGYFVSGISTFLASFSQVFWVLLVFKFIGGFFICGPISLLKTYTVEFHGEKSRAQVLMWQGVFGSTSNVIIPGIAWLLIPQDWSWTLFGHPYHSWRLFMAVCATPGLFAALFIFLLPESPRFLVAQGDHEKAMVVLQRMYTTNTGCSAETYPVKTFAKEKQYKTGIPLSDKNLLGILNHGWGQIKPLFHHPYRPVVALCVAALFGSMYGCKTLQMWLPQLFATMEQISQVKAASNSSGAEILSVCELLATNEMANHTVVLPQSHCSSVMLEDAVYINSITVNTICAAGFIIASFSVNHLGKRNIIIYGFLVAGTCILTVYWSRSVVAILVIASLSMTLSAICGMATISVLVEQLPTHLRTMGVSFSMMCGQIGVMFGNLIFPVLSQINCTAPFFLIGVTLISCSGLSFMLPAQGNNF